MAIDGKTLVKNQFHARNRSMTRVLVVNESAGGRGGPPAELFSGFTIYPADWADTLSGRPPDGLECVAVGWRRDHPLRGSRVGVLDNFRRYLFLLLRRGRSGCVASASASPSLSRSPVR